VAGFYTARSRPIQPLPSQTFVPPFHCAGSGLLAAMPGLILPCRRVVWRQFAETRPCIGQELTWLALRARHQSPPLLLIAATVRRLQRSASAVTTLPMSAIRPSISSTAPSSAPSSAATVAGIRRRQATEGRHHHGP